jgi:Low-density lipoprotein receptor repeat class B
MKGHVMKRIFSLAVMSWVLIGLSVESAVGQVIYWVELDFPIGRLLRSDLNGGNVVTLIEDTGLRGFAVDAEAGHLYWGASAAPTGRIMRSDLDGTNAVLFLSILGTPSDIAIDKTNDMIYWSDSAEGRIQRANIDGTGVELLDMIGFHVTAIELDVAGGKMYYGVTSLDSVRRAGLDGTNPEILVTDAGSVVALALDLVNQKLYYTDPGVQRSNFDGSAIETVSNTGSFGLAVVPADGHLYWTNSVDETVRRADLDGSNEQVVVAGLANPRRIVVIGGEAGVPVPTAGAWSMIVLAMLLLTAATVTLGRQRATVMDHPPV